MSVLSRQFEFEADRYAVRTLGSGEMLISALKKLHKDNLSFPLNDHYYSVWFHSHPPILERMAAIRAEILLMESND
jgi:STE24 endopeptidase